MSTQSHRRPGLNPAPLPGLLALLITVAGSPGASALTQADQLIQNQATATYEDASGNSYSSQSNLASIRVKQVFSAALEQDRDKQGAPGQTVYFSHTLTNTGNGSDTYTVSIAQSVTGGVDLNFQGTSLKVYEDTNSNGEVDAGETEIASVGSDGNVSLTRAGTPGDTIQLVVQGAIPAAALETQTAGATLTVTPTSGTVTDATTGKGRDAADGTNEDLVTVTGNAVLNISKSSTYSDGGTSTDLSDDTITYTVTATNTGNGDADNAILFDGIPQGMQFDSIVSSNGLGNAGDTAATNVALAESTLTVAVGFNVDLNGDGDQTDDVESTLGVDLNGDGATTSGAVDGVYAVDASLPPNTTVSITYRVSYASPTTIAAGTDINNTAYFAADVTDDPGTGTPDGDTEDTGETGTSNTTTHVVPQVYAVDTDDTEENTGGDGINDGQDDDGDNDTQTVDTVPSGALVLFDAEITNNGNGTDTLDLSVAVGSFPAGTVFTFWDATGTTQLLDNDGDSVPDTGPLAAGATLNIVVKAQLPAGSTSGAPVTATLTATSSGDTGVSDDMTLQVGAITAPGVDLANDPADNDPLTDNNDYVSGATAPIADPLQTRTGDIGDTVTLDLTIENDSGTPDAFQLSAGGGWDGGSTLEPLPAGWTVVFKDQTCAAGGGNTVTTTTNIPGGGEVELCAYVTVPSDVTQAEADHQADIDGGGAGGTVTVNANDSDGDYAILFKAQSVNTGASDVVIDAVDVNDREDISLTPNNTGQIQPGGSIDYSHTVSNNGNTQESLTLSGSNSGSGFTNSILLDTTGDGVPDTDFGALTAVSTVYYYDATSTLQSQVVGGDGTIELGPGESLPATARVFAPTNAPAGTIDTLTITTGYNGGGTTVTATDQTTVVLGQVRLEKYSALDDDCDGAPSGGSGGFAKTQVTDKVEPGQCVVWRVVATNEGTASVSRLVINDAVQAFTQVPTDYLTMDPPVDDTVLMRSCAGDAGTDTTGTGCTTGALDDGGKAHTDSDDAEAQGDGHFAKRSGGSITFYLGTGAAQSAGGSLGAGASVSVQFTTQVQ